MSWPTLPHSRRFSWAAPPHLDAAPPSWWCSSRTHWTPSCSHAGETGPAHTCNTQTKALVGCLYALITHRFMETHIAVSIKFESRFQDTILHVFGNVVISILVLWMLKFAEMFNQMFLTKDCIFEHCILEIQLSTVIPRILYPHLGPCGYIVKHDNMKGLQTTNSCFK